MATVLFLTAIAQRFEIVKLRTALLGLAFAMMVVSLGVLLTYPHL